MSKQEPKQSPLGAFFEHQGKALEETGKALASLLPKPFREHLSNAVDEGRAGWEALIDGVVDSVQEGIDKVRSTPKPDPDEKVKIEVD